jgi:hypothetical protein
MPICFVPPWKNDRNLSFLEYIKLIKFINYVTLILYIKVCYNKPPHLLVYNFFTRGISLLHRPVLYTLHSISGQNIFIRMESRLMSVYILHMGSSEYEVLSSHFKGPYQDKLNMKKSLQFSIISLSKLCVISPQKHYCPKEYEYAS